MSLIKGIDRLWRALGTGFFLAAIGVGGTVMACTIFPFIVLVTRDPLRRQFRIQSAMQASLRLYCAAIRMLRIADITIIGAEKVRELRGTLVVANHPSLLDVVMIMSVIPRAQCVVKSGLWKNIFFRLTLDGVGYIRNDLPPEDLIQACINTLAAGNNLIIFPEGTRTVAGRLGRFQRGFANIAILARADLQLMTMVVDPIMLHKGNPWWRAPSRRTRFTLDVGKRLDIDDFLAYQFHPIAVRRLVAFLEDHYAQITAAG